MINHLATAVVNQLRHDLKLTDHHVRLMPDDKPIPTMKDLFISVYGSNWAFPGEQELQLNETYEITTAITVRHSAQPYESFGTSKYLTSYNSIMDTAREIILSLHNNWDVVCKASELTKGNYEINRTLKIQSADANPQVVDSDWFWFQQNIPENYDIQFNCGLTMQLVFGEAARTQPINDGDYE